MVGPVARALARAALTAAAAVGLVMALLVLAPGDPTDLVPGGHVVRGQLAQQWGLDRGPVGQWFWGTAAVLTGQWGTSLTYRPGASVAQLVLPAVARTATWLVAAFALSTLLATGLAYVRAARRPWLRYSVRWLSAAPVFLLAHVVVRGANALTFAGINAGFWNRPEWFALPDQASATRTAIAITVLAVASGALTELHAEVEAAYTAARNSPYVDAARARGQSTNAMIARNMVAPTASLLASRAAFFAGGMVILERVMLLNGAGSMLWRASLMRDYPVAVAVALFAALWVVACRAAADLARLTADPRLAGR